MKYCTILARIATQLILYSSIKSQEPELLQMCGIEASAIPITTNFFLRLVLIVCIPYVCRFYRKLGFENGFFGEILSSGERLLTLRMGILLAFKIIIGLIFGQFNIWFVLKAGILELALISACVGIDTFSFFAGEAAEIIFIDPFLITITIFQMSQTYCSKFPLFQIGFNLIVLSISAVEGFAFFTQKVNTIYTKQDAYRLLMTTIIFQILFSIASINHFHYKYAASFIAGVPFMIIAMKKFKESSFKISLIYLSLMLVVVVGVRLAITNSYDPSIIPVSPITHQL